jgi:SAM-dependent methyltransferase
MICRLCKSKNTEVIYSGPFRSSGINSDYVMGYEVLECQHCTVVFMDPFPSQPEENYTSPKYWLSHKEAENFNKLLHKSYPEQLLWLESVGIHQFIGKKVLDYGCGLGLFLNLLSKVSSETHGFDLSSHFDEFIRRNGHSFYSDSSDIPTDYFDVVVSFDTLEHVEKPKEFLSSIFNCLSENGVLVIGLPNFDDFTKKLVPDYRKFFYHLSHLWFFRRDVLEGLLVEIGFKILDATSVHKYDINNLVNWAKDDKPTGKSGSMLDSYTEKSFRNNIERMGIGSHLLIIAEK